MGTETKPTPPAELWGLWRNAIPGKQTPGWMVAIDCAGNPIITFLSRDDAECSAKCHARLYGIECVPVLLTGGAR